MLARQPFPHQVCSLDAAAQLFEKESRRAGVPFARAGFAAAISALRATIEQQIAPRAARRS